jgi:hypothetical protein
MSEFLQPELPGMPTVVELDGGAYDLLREVNTCTDAIKKWEERKLSAHDQLLKILTGGCEDEATYEGTWNGRGVVKATVYIERRFNSRAFQSDHPALYDSYRQPLTRTRLTPDPAA